MRSLQECSPDKIFVARYDDEVAKPVQPRSIIEVLIVAVVLFVYEVG